MGIAEFLVFVLLMIKLFSSTSLSWFQVFLPMIIIYGFIGFILIIVYGYAIIRCWLLNKSLNKRSK